MFYLEKLSSRFGEEESVKLHVGRVEWIVSFADRQAVILRRTVLSKTCDDDVRESAGDDFMMQAKNWTTATDIRGTLYYQNVKHADIRRIGISHNVSVCLSSGWLHYSAT